MKRRLLHLQLLPLMSGVQRFSLHLLDGLPESDYEIFVASQPGGEFEDVVRSRGWNYLPLRTLRHPISILDAAALVELIQLMRSYKFDIVHTNSSKPGLLGRLAARLCGVPRIIHTVHGTPFQDRQHPLVQAFYRNMERIGNSLGHRTIFVNNSDRENCLKLGLLTPDKAETIFNAMSEDMKPSLWTKVTQPGMVTIGSTIRFSDQKNVIALICAACKACHQSSALRFIILGDGEHHDLCRSIVATHHLNERILLPGWDSNVAPWLNKFDAFILYSRWEAMPYSIIEAMKAGLPVIGSAIPSISEFVDSKSGWLVPLDDESALISTLVEISRHPEELIPKGIDARSHIQELSNYDQMVAAYRRVYES